MCFLDAKLHSLTVADGSAVSRQAILPVSCPTSYSYLFSPIFCVVSPFTFPVTAAIACSLSFLSITVTFTCTFEIVFMCVFLLWFLFVLFLYGLIFVLSFSLYAPMVALRLSAFNCQLWSVGCLHLNGRRVFDSTYAKTFVCFGHQKVKFKNIRKEIGNILEISS